MYAVLGWPTFPCRTSADGQVRVKVMEKVVVTIQPLGEGSSRES